MPASDGQVDDAALLGVRWGMAAEHDEVQALQVDVDDAVPLGLGGLGARPLGPHPGGVDDAIEPAVPVHRSDDGLPTLPHIAEVGHHRQHAVGCRDRGDVDRRHCPSTADEPFDTGAADTAGCACDQRDASAVTSQGRQRFARDDGAPGVPGRRAAPRPPSSPW